jgi:hypothetical protein
MRSSEAHQRQLVRFEPGSSYVQVRGIQFGQCFFHVHFISKITGETHHMVVADCDLTACWGNSINCKGHDFGIYYNRFHDTQLHDLDGSKAGGWYWCAGGENYIGTNGEWKNPANISFIGNVVRRTGGEGLILARCTSGLAVDNDIMNALSVGLYWQNGINLTIVNNIVGADEHRFFQAWPGGRPMGIAGAIESWDDRVPVRPTTNIVIRDNILMAGDGMMSTPIKWISRTRDNDPEVNTYGGMTIMDNVVVGNPTNKDVVIDKLLNLSSAPGPQNVIRHDGPVSLGDPSYWDVLSP